MNLPSKRRNDAGPSTFERELERIHQETCIKLRVYEGLGLMQSVRSIHESCEAEG